MTTLYKALAGLALALALVASLWGNVALWASRAKAQEATQKAEKALAQTQRTLASRERQRAATARKVASAQASQEAVLSRNPAWAQQPVPQEVQDDLCKTLRCADSPGADGVRSSDDRP